MLAWCGVSGETGRSLNSMAYQQVLEEHMLTDAAALIGDDFVFQQDNAPIHMSWSTRQWLRQHDVIHFLGLVFRNAKRKVNNLGSTVFSRNLTINAVTIKFLTILIVGKL